MELGLGRSGHPYQLSPFGVGLEETRGMWEEALAILPRDWTEDVFCHRGKYDDIPPREVVPKPLQKPHPPLWGACNQEDTAYLTGKMGFGCLVITHRGAERAQKLISLYKDAISQAEPQGKFIHNHVAANTLAYCGEAREKARARGAELLDWYRNMQRIREERNWQDIDLEDIPEDHRFHLQKGADARGGDNVTGRDLVATHRFCMGDPEDCIKFIAQFAAIGVEALMFNFQLGPVAQQEIGVAGSIVAGTIWRDLLEPHRGIGFRQQLTGNPSGIVDGRLQHLGKGQFAVPTLRFHKRVDGPRYRHRRQARARNPLDAPPRQRF